MTKKPAAFAIAACLGCKRFLKQESPILSATGAWPPPALSARSGTWNCRRIGDNKAHASWKASGRSFPLALKEFRSAEVRHRLAGTPQDRQRRITHEEVRIYVGVRRSGVHHAVCGFGASRRGTGWRNRWPDSGRGGKAVGGYSGSDRKRAG